MTAQALLSRTLTEFFRDLLKGAMETREVRSSEDTEFYLVKLLEAFARPSKDWFDRPLAIDYLESFQSSAADRYLKLKRVADTSLFVSGMFMEMIERTPVGCEYYIRLGQHAYGHLATSGPTWVAGKPFGELSQQFREFVSVLSEISFNELFRGETDLVRRYARWLYTRSRQDYQWLARHGLMPIPVSDRTRH